MITVLWYLWLTMAIGFGVSLFFVVVRIVMWLAIAAYRVTRWIVGKPNKPRRMSRLPPLSPYLLPKRHPVTVQPPPSAEVSSADVSSSSI
jgi:hypothetical protein